MRRSLPPQRHQLHWSAVSELRGGLHHGNADIGDVLISIPSSAVQGQTYSVHVQGTSAALGNLNVPLGAGPDSTITVVPIYAVSDVFPYSSDSAGSFGDSPTDTTKAVVNTLDLIYTLRAATAIPGFVPTTCSMLRCHGLLATDTVAGRGGDGVLNTLDLLETLRRATGIDTTKPTRTEAAERNRMDQPALRPRRSQSIIRSHHESGQRRGCAAIRRPGTHHDGAWRTRLVHANVDLDWPVSVSRLATKRPLHFVPPARRRLMDQPCSAN